MFEDVFCNSAAIVTTQTNTATTAATTITGSHYILVLKFKDFSRTFKDFQGP